ncbi:TPA: phage tail protein, partial [Salmonella enterica]
MYSLIVQHIELITGEIMSCFTSPAIMEMLGHYRWRVYEPF